MDAVVKHITRCLVAGIVALLPIGATLFTIWYLEATVADPWLKKQPWYFPGLGLVLVGVIIYLLGLTVTTFIGKWFWRTIDRVLDRLPVLGTLYQTLKQLVGYSEGKDAIFKQVVLIDVPEADGQQIGLVTNRIADSEGRQKLLVFVPGAPTPTTGRLIIADAEQVEPVDATVSQVMQTLVSVGATSLSLTAASQEEPQPAQRQTPPPT